MRWNVARTFLGLIRDLRTPSLLDRSWLTLISLEMDTQCLFRRNSREMDTLHVKGVHFNNLFRSPRVALHTVPNIKICSPFSKWAAAAFFSVIFRHLLEAI